MNDLIQLPFKQPDPLQVPLEALELQRQGAIVRVLTATGDEAWLASGYARVRKLLSDDRFGRTHRDPESAPRATASAFGGPLGNFVTEYADHARMRSLLQPHFSPRRIRALAPRISAHTRRVLDDLERQGPRADLHTHVALPLPLLVICELLGVPFADRADFRTWAEDASDVTDRDRSGRGVGQLFTYAMELVTRKRKSPEDDLISRLCAMDDVPDHEAAMATMSLLFAGHETTVIQIDMGVLMLLANPGEWESLVADPGLVPNAVEEIMRAPAKAGFGLPRYARTDVEIDGVDIRAGDLVLLDISAANHDPAMFAEPERVEIRRAEAAQHLTFGHGLRYCLGAPLARLELQEVLSQLISRFPTLSLDGKVEDLTTRNGIAGGLLELPVRW
ncbi:cytochrome P450 [Nocardia sp. CC201C]|uniref:cytochrome P450 n=1 Tax=Nocardia sp. CC201C TaxID=3044575 RepID=UPI0024A96101|nr:cytochrome P450 [Nocardia sp. CC201C]